MVASVRGALHILFVRPIIIKLRRDGGDTEKIIIYLFIYLQQDMQLQCRYRQLQFQHFEIIEIIRVSCGVCLLEQLDYSLRKGHNWGGGGTKMVKQKLLQYHKEITTMNSIFLPYKIDLKLSLLHLNNITRLMYVINQCIYIRINITRHSVFT